MSESSNTPAPAPAAAPAGVPAGERVWGLFGLVAAVALALMATDLVTGGALSRLVRAKGEGDGDAGVRREG